ncbi:MAG: 7-carboxy-7-deazaguanine synthase QueE [Vampirovibrionales bacterium]|nr:7-carboxy-7-deazaguanine synthase QueE [Vampirovibrionales bacterium]
MMPHAQDVLTEAYAPIQSIFSSVQGEGPYVGHRQLFVRFAHCHLKCRYCDTPMMSATGQCHWEKNAGSGDETLIENPISQALFHQLLLTAWGKVRHHSVSLTGGEPLLYHRFLANSLPELVHQGLRFYLETSGTQPLFLKEVLPWLSVIAMDIKLPSATGEAADFENQADFYRLAVSESDRKAQTFIKLIFEHTIPDDELAAIRDIVRHADTPIFLQPMTLPEDSENPSPRLACSARELFRLIDVLQGHFHQVRVVPQTHKLLNIL